MIHRLSTALRHTAVAVVALTGLATSAFAHDGNAARLDRRVVHRDQGGMLAHVHRSHAQHASHHETNRHGERHDRGHDGRHHDGRNAVDVRQHRQAELIRHGAATGRLTDAEVHRLVHQQRHIRRAEARAEADGHVSWQERERLHQLQADARRDIGREMHDHQRD